MQETLKVGTVLALVVTRKTETTMTRKTTKRATRTSRWEVATGRDREIASLVSNSMDTVVRMDVRDLPGLQELCQRLGSRKNRSCGPLTTDEEVLSCF